MRLFLLLSLLLYLSIPVVANNDATLALPTAINGI